jgi:ATP phosphoribosyltransferase regulatory subunit
MAPALLDATGVQGALRGRLARALDRKDAARVAALAAEAGPPAIGLTALLQAAGPADGALDALAAASLPPAARAIADNAAAVVEAIRVRAPSLRITLDPVEFRGFRYHTGVAFTFYGEGRVGELGRGGRYLSLGDEPATGMSVYPDAVLRAAPPTVPRPRVFVPLGSDPEVARALRAQGFATIAALSAADAPRALGCTHVLRDGAAVPLGKDG